MYNKDLFVYNFWKLLADCLHCLSNKFFFFQFVYLFPLTPPPQPTPPHPPFFLKKKLFVILTGGNPHGPFWEDLNISFDETIPYHIGHNPEEWKEMYEIHVINNSLILILNPLDFKM